MFDSSMHVIQKSMNLNELEINRSGNSNRIFLSDNMIR